jgi:hypothetical protein
VEPGGLGVGRGNGDEEPSLAPREDPVGEGVAEEREIAQLPRHAGELLELAAGDAERLAGVVVEADESEALVRAPAEEGMSQAAEDAAAERFLAGQAAEKRVEQLGAAIAVEVTPFLTGGRIEKLWRDEIHKGED